MSKSTKKGRKNANLNNNQDEVPEEKRGGRLLGGFGFTGEDPRSFCAARLVDRVTNGIPKKKPPDGRKLRCAPSGIVSSYLY